MNIVVLDGYTTNPGDLDWQALQSLGRCTIYDRTPKELIVARAADAEILLTNKTLLFAETLAQLPKLRYIGLLSTGVNAVDVEAARKKNIIVTHIPAYSTESVAQHVFALLFELTNHIGDHASSVRNGEWSQSKDFCYWHFPLVELAGKNFGIVGFGNIGQAVAKIASALGMNVLVSTRSPEKYKTLQVFKTCNVSFVDSQTLFSTSDVISLHCALTGKTKHLINAERLAIMKPNAYLINTSRGGIVDEDALAAALNAEKIAGAGLDVLSTEPPKITNPLLAAKNCIITPHIAWATFSARQRLMNIVVKNVQAFLENKPINVVHK